MGNLNREYTPARRVAMTVVMWLILATTVGLAALSSRYPVEVPALDPDAERILRDLRQDLPPSRAPN